MKHFMITPDMAHSIVQSSIAKEPMLLMCDSCKRLLMRIPKGENTFDIVRGPCDCSWRCCMSRGDHAPHLISVPDGGDVAETLQEERVRRRHR